MANDNINQGIERGEYRAAELEFSSYCSGAAPVYCNGITAGSFTTAGKITGVNVTNTGSTMLTKNIQLELTGSPYGEGIVYSFTCAGAITGGQFVAVAGGLATAAGALGKATGIAYGSTNYTSGTSAAIKVLMYGLKYVTCADNVSDGDYAIAGSAVHRIQSGAAGATSFAKVLSAASSGGTALIMVGKL